MTNLLYKLVYILTSTIGIITLFLSKIDIEKISITGFIIQLLFAGVISFFVGELLCLSRVCRIIAGISATIWMIICLVFGYPIEKLFVVVTFFLILLTVTEEIQIRWKKQGQVDRKGHVVYIAPFIIIIAVIVLLAPAPDEPYDWTFAKKIYSVVADAVEGIIDNISELFSGESDGNPAETTIGFSERGDILASLSGDDKTAITVSGLSPVVDQIRLSGQTFNNFDGKSWSNNDKSNAPATLIDTISMCASINDFTEKSNDYVRKSYIRIKYENINTNHVFAPSKSIPDNNFLRTKDYTEEGGNIILSEKKSTNSFYALSYFILNKDNPILDEYMKNSKRATEKSYDDTEKRLNTIKQTGCTYNDYLSYIDYVKNSYTSAPTLSPKVRAYSDEIFKGENNDYKKMKKLETALRKLTYDLSPGPLPEKIGDASDFLDYFLFESKKGFCTHFATAFVLLARAEGLPARYVQGYMVNSDGKTSVSVKNSNAHAWPEIYFEGMGWIAFEPTATIDSGHFYWETGTENTATTNTTENHTYNNSDRAKKEAANINFFSHFKIEWYTIAIPVIAGLIFIILALIIIHLVSASRFRKMSYEKKFSTLCRQNLRILKLCGLEIKTGETLREYSLRLQENGIEDINFPEDYERYLYRGDVATGAVNRANTDKINLKTILKKKNRLRALFLIQL